MPLAHCPTKHHVAPVSQIDDNSRTVVVKTNKWPQELARHVRGPVLTDEPLAPYTTLRIGGPADALFTPRDEEDLEAALEFARRRGIESRVIGLGSNLLVSDTGARGLVVRVAGGRKMKFDGRRASAWAGVPLATLSREAAMRGLSGLEPLAGIPGTVGGAVWMNAGAFGAEIGVLVTRVEAVAPGGERLAFRPEECGFGYRTSGFQTTPERTLTRVSLSLKEDDPEKIQAKMREILAERRKKQPGRVRTAGSTFKNPPGTSAAVLIDRSDLKGTAVGGAKISEKHANFFINTGGATCEDFLRLMELTVSRVRDVFKVTLEPEVRELK